MRNVRKPVSLLLIMAMLIGVICVAPFSVSAATKTTSSTADGDFIEISTTEQLVQILTAPSTQGNYILTDDFTVDTSEWSVFYDDGNRSHSSRIFYANLNGNNHTITMKTTGNGNLKPLFDVFSGTLSNININCENTVEGAVVMNYTDNNYYVENVSVTFTKVTFANYNLSLDSRACGFVAYNAGNGTIKDVTITGGDIGEKTTNNNIHNVYAAGFTYNYLNSQGCIFDGITIDIDGVYVNYSNTEANDGYAIACGAFAQNHITGAAYKDISVHIKNDIIAKSTKGTMPLVLACGLSVCTSYARNLSVKVDGGIYAEGYSFTNSRFGIDDYNVVPFGAFGLCYKLIPIQDEEFYPFAEHYADIGALKVDVGKDISTKVFESNEYPNRIYSMGIAKDIRDEMSYLNTKVTVRENILTEANNQTMALSDGVALTTSDRYDCNTRMENAEVNVKNIIANSKGSAYANGFIHSIDAMSVSNCKVEVKKIETNSDASSSCANGFAYNSYDGHPIYNCVVNADTIKSVSDSFASWVNGFINTAEDILENNTVTVGLLYAASPLQNMAGGFCVFPAVSVSNADNICVYNCDVNVDNITIPNASTYGDFAGGFAVVSDSNNNTIQTIIDSCEINIGEVNLPDDSYFGLFISDNNSYNGNTPLNGFHLTNNSVSIPENYVDIYTIGNYDYVKYTFSEKDGRAHNVAEIPSYDNYNDWENNNTVTIGNKAYRTVCAFDDGQSVSNDGTLWQLQEIDNSFRFHVNEPNAADDKLFRVYNGDASTAGAEDTTDYTFTNGGVTAFYDIPAFAGDDYVFAGWYYNSTDGTSDGTTPFEFGSAVPAGVTDVYAHWIAVGTVAQDSSDGKILPGSMSNTYKGFELFGVQIRPEDKRDLNQEKKMPGGLRYVTSISESLLSSVDALSTQTVNGNKVEYGFVTAKEDTINAAITKINTDNPGAINPSTYKLQYRGTNVNGVDTIMDNLTKQERATANNFRYVTNVDCTSRRGGYGGNATIKMDHFNSDNNYRLATFVVTYEDNASDINKNIIARAYMRYYDANGLLRTFYNDYDGTYGGCNANYDDINTSLANNNNGIG